VGYPQQENKGSYLCRMRLKCILNISFEFFCLENSPKSKDTGKQFNFILGVFAWAFSLIELLPDLSSKIFNRCNDIIDSGLIGTIFIFLFELFIFFFESHV